MPSRVKVFFDGGCRPNPGMMETAVVVRGQAHIERAIGHGTSMDAEWRALIAALRIALSLGLPDFVLLGDSAAVVGQATGTTKSRGSNLIHLQTFHAIAPGLPRVRYIKRSQNLAGIALANLRLVPASSKIAK